MSSVASTSGGSTPYSSPPKSNTPRRTPRVSRRPSPDDNRRRPRSKASVGAAMHSRVDDGPVRAMVLDAPGGPLRLVPDATDPEPGAGDALVAVHACGVCRTDLHIVDGELPASRAPLVPGHQVVGTVLATGAEAEV